MLGGVTKPYHISGWIIERPEFESASPGRSGSRRKHFKRGTFSVRPRTEFARGARFVTKPAPATDADLLARCGRYFHEKTCGIVSSGLARLRAGFRSGRHTAIEHGLAIEHDLAIGQQDQRSGGQPDGNTSLARHPRGYELCRR